MHEKRFKKIGIWNTAFLGDAVLTLPLIQKVKATYPEAEVHFFVRKGFESLFQAQRELTSTRGYAKRGDQKSLKAAVNYAHSLRNENFDLWISSHTSMRSALIAHQSAIPNRIGFDSPWYNKFAYTQTVDRKFNELEEIERLFQLAEPLGITLPAPAPRMDLPIEDTEYAESLFQRRVGDKPCVGIHPGSTWPTKCWPADYFTRLIEIAVDNGVTPVLFGGPGEEALAQKIIYDANVPASAVMDLSGQLTLTRLAACISMLSVYVTNDSGPMHISWVQNVPTVAFFGPTVKELGFFPRGQNSIVLEEKMDCRPCGLHGHKKCPKSHHNCMKNITPERAWDAIKVFCS
ncbi:MAG: lipopolysaccharide heptosyltransferase II [Desulfovibrio sp.]